LEDQLTFGIVPRTVPPYAICKHINIARNKVIQNFEQFVMYWC